MLSNNFVYRTCMRTSRNCHLSSEVIPYIFFKNILFCWKLQRQQLLAPQWLQGKEQVEKEGEIINSESAWTMWKLGGIIGAASLTGVTVMAFTGGNTSVWLARYLSIEICDNMLLLKLFMTLNRISCPSNCTGIGCYSSQVWQVLSLQLERVDLLQPLVQWDQLLFQLLLLLALEVLRCRSDTADFIFKVVGIS